MQVAAAMQDKLTAALMAYASKKMDGGCALFDVQEDGDVCYDLHPSWAFLAFQQNRRLAPI